MSGQAAFPNLRHLRLLLRICDGASVRASAQEMRLTQPAATSSLAALERRYGIALFERRPGGLHGMPAAEILARRARRCFAFLKQAVSQVRSDVARDPERDAAAVRLLTVAQLRALAAIDAHPGFTAAAQALGLKPASLHRAIGDLEQTVGVKLVRRDRRGVCTTHRGHMLAGAFTLALQELEAADAELHEAIGVLTGEITVGAVRLSASSLIPEAIIQVSAVAPEASFRVVQEDYPDMLDGLRAGRLDILCTTIRPNLPRDVVGEKLSASELRIICRRGHPLADRTSVPLVELARGRWIGAHDDKTGAAQRFRELFESEGIRAPKPTVRTQHFALTRSLLLSADFLALVTCWDIAHDHALDGLIVIDRVVPAAERPLWLLRRLDWHPTKLQAQFADTLRRVARAPIAKVSGA